MRSSERKESNKNASKRGDIDPPRGGCYEPYNLCSHQYSCRESQRSRRPLSSSVQVEAQLGSGVRNRDQQSFCGRVWAKKDEKNVEGDSQAQRLGSMESSATNERGLHAKRV